MHYIVYVSSAIEPFSPQALLDLLAQSRENNRRLGVTGMLLYKDGNFMQYLEGDAAAVRALFDKVARDPRHRGVFIVDEGEAAQREFGDWSMGFHRLVDRDLAAVPGYSAFMDRSLATDGLGRDPAACLELLRLFRDLR